MTVLARPSTSLSLRRETRALAPLLQAAVDAAAFAPADGDPAAAAAPIDADSSCLSYACGAVGIIIQYKDSRKPRPSESSDGCLIS